jgi:hypothetical protein
MGEQQKWKMGEQRNKDKHARWRRALEDDKTCRYRHAVVVHTQAHGIGTQQKGRHNEEAQIRGKRDSA